MHSGFRGRDFVVSDDGPAARSRESLAVHGAEFPGLPLFSVMPNAMPGCSVSAPMQSSQVALGGAVAADVDRASGEPSGRPPRAGT